MMFLDSPALTAPKKEWETWHNKLTRMNRYDPSVAFALKRAETVLEQIAMRESAAPSAAGANQTAKRAENGFETENV